MLLTLSRLIINKFKPEVVLVVGTSGKSLIKEALRVILKKEQTVGRSSDIFLGIANLGQDKVGKVALFFRLCRLILFGDSTYSKILLLEVGVAEIASISTIMRNYKCIIVATEIAGCDYSLERCHIKDELNDLLGLVAKDSIIVANIDDKHIVTILGKTKLQQISFAINGSAIVTASNIAINITPHELDSGEISFKVHYQGNAVPVFLTGVVGQIHVYNALAAISCGIALGLHLVEISKELAEYRGLPGRSRLIKGVKSTVIIDDTYDSSPKSLLEVISVLSALKSDNGGADNIIILGDTPGFGKNTEEYHKRVGKEIAALNPRMLVTVGQMGTIIRQGAYEAGFLEERGFHFSCANECSLKETGLFVQDKMRAGDILLIKGAKYNKLECIVQEVMADPQNTSQILVR